MRAPQDLGGSYLLQLHDEDLLSKIQRVTEFFKGPILPSPTRELDAAWQELPNRVFPMLLGFESVVHSTPPPTPIQDVIVEDDPSFNEAVLYNPSRYDASQHRDEIDSSLPDWGLYTYQDNLENSLRPATSDHTSSPSTHRDPSTPREFRFLVDRWISEYQTQGLERFVDALIESGLESPDSASLTSRLARAIIKDMRWTSKSEGDNLRSTIRFSVLAVFKRHWEPTVGTWLDASSTTTNDVSIIQRGHNLAGLIGALFDTEVLSAKDVHLCLSMLLEGDKHIDRSRAMQALLNHANDKLCKRKNRDALMAFKTSITANDGSGEYLWVTSRASKAILEDILEIIQRWMALQEMKRERR